MAAVRGQKFHQLPHRSHVGAVAQKTALPLLCDQAAVMQFFQMKGQQVRGNRQCVGNPARTQTVGACANQQAKYPQARSLGEGGQRPDGTGFPGQVRAAIHAVTFSVLSRPSGSLRVISQQMNSISAEPISA